MVELKRISAFLGKRNTKKIISIGWGLLIFIFISTLFQPPILGQEGNNLPFKQPKVENLFTALNNSNINTGKVSLDGYDLFTVAASNLGNNEQNQTGNLTPVERRVDMIESNLNRFVKKKLPVNQLEITYKQDNSSNLPVIYINNQYLMTVTSLDAQLQGTTPQIWASELTRIIRNSLIKARQERQPDYLIQQGFKTIGIAIASTILVLLIRFFQGRIYKQQEQLKSEIASESQILVKSKQDTDINTISSALRRIRKEQGYNIYGIRKLFLQLAQIVIVGSTVFVILGLFPQTRFLQPFIYSTPLKVFSIAFCVYIFIRVCNVAIDRLVNIFNSSSFVTPRNYQRLTLRISTFSQVLKSVNVFIWVCAGILIGLSLLGVDVIPFLAGAGIIGLAISFASQGLIKDIINGSLILLEDQYAVGDVIVVGNVGGLVENMNLRITQLRNDEGRLITIPNSSISIVENLSKDWSRVNLTIEVAYQTNPDAALNAIKKLAEEIYQEAAWKEKIIELPEVLGIDRIDHSGMLIRIWIKTQPLQQWSVAREFRRRLRLTMEQAGINVGIPQDLIWFNSVDLESDRNTSKIN